VDVFADAKPGIRRAFADPDLSHRTVRHQKSARLLQPAVGKYKLGADCATLRVRPQAADQRS